MRIPFKTLALTAMIASASMAFSAIPAQTQEAARIDELLAIVNNDKLMAERPREMVDAMIELGKLKAEKAAPALAEHLDFRFGGISSHAMAPTLVDYPAMGALIQIGEHAIPAVVQAIAVADRSPQFERNAATTVLQIQGIHEAETIKVFQAAIDKYGEDKKAERDRLRRIIAILNGQIPSSGHDSP